MSAGAWAEGTGSLPTRIEREGFRTAERLGSGYRPTAWCLNQGCHIPLPVGTLVCPECNTRQVRACPCTDGHRNLPLTDCPICGGVE